MGSGNPALLCGARHATITIFGQCLITGSQDATQQGKEL